MRLKASGEIEDVITGLSVPTAMTFGPDGALYISGCCPRGIRPDPPVYDPIRELGRGHSRWPLRPGHLDSASVVTGPNRHSSTSSCRAIMEASALLT